jgi:hypothetical protein
MNTRPKLRTAHLHVLMTPAQRELVDRAAKEKDCSSSTLAAEAATLLAKTILGMACLGALWGCSGAAPTVLGNVDDPIAAADASEAGQAAPLPPACEVESGAVAARGNVKPGDPCKSTEDCRKGLYCLSPDSVGQRVCLQQATQAGVACSADDQCGGSFPHCALGLKPAEGDGLGACEGFLAVGSPCSDQDLECAPGAFCGSLGICQICPNVSDR